MDSGLAPAARPGMTSEPDEPPDFPTQDTGGPDGHIARAEACAVPSTKNGSCRAALEQSPEHVVRVRQRGVPPRALLPRQPFLLLPAQFLAVAGRREGLVLAARRI